MVTIIQSFGQKINSYSHAHLRVTEGGECHHLDEFQGSRLAEFFSREVFSLLFRRELISEALVGRIAG
ncbi:MAG: transposase [Candidatus Saccharicenans sp.]|uniref:transposase n=1 Tax=Candidatus Saccharicenans sp. TaxID=2819258 RepID=UPI00404AF2DE